MITLRADAARHRFVWADSAVRERQKEKRLKGLFVEVT